MRLSDCLAAANWRTLAAIAQTHRLPMGLRPTRADLVDILMGELPRRVASMRRAGLDAPAAEALATLGTAEGQIRLPDFVAVYGEVRSLTGVKGEDPRRLARQPISTTEWLVFRGLAFVVPSPERGQPPLIVLPDVWRADFRPSSPPAGIDHPADTPRWPDVSLALTVYLAALRAASPPLLKDARLRAATLRHVASLLGQPDPAAAADGLDWARFLEFLARRLGLTLPLGRCLHPTPLAAAWLDQPLNARRADLWRAWLDETDLRPVWRLYRLPAATLPDPAAFTHRLLDRLRAIGQPADAHSRPWQTLDNLAPPGDPGRLVADLVPWWEMENRPGLGRNRAWQVMRGPLTWLGALEWVEPAHVWRLTDLGVWYLGLDETPPPEPAAPSLPLTLMTPEGDGQPRSIPLGSALLSLADWVDLTPGPLDTPWLPQLRLTVTSATRGLQRGGSIDDLLRLLTTTAHPAPSDAFAATLRAWVAPRAPFRLHPAVVLRAPSEAHLDILLRSRAARRSVTRRLSATDAEVDPSGLPRVRSALVRLGHALDPATPHAAADPPPGRPPLHLDAADVAWLLTSLDGYAELARRLGLPPPPAALADRLTVHLDPLTQDGARRAALHAADRLDRTLRDLDSALAPVPTDTLLVLLETAIQDNAAVHVRYWTPSRPAPLSRTVSPRRIEWHGDTPYLVAYCHLRRDERTFRLDRILAIDPIQSCTARPS